MKYGDIIYYQDEQNDEVVKFNVISKKIDKNYKYNHNKLNRLLSVLTYSFALPFVWFYFKLLKKVKFHNRKILKQLKNTGYFIYANHTNQFCDGFCPSLLTFPKKAHIICNAENVSMKFFGKITQLLGAIPLPNTIEASKNFNNKISTILKNNNPVVIYPEAHLWPYYTKIRPFSNLSFRYPIKFNKPIVAFTTVYRLNKIGRKPKIHIYVDGPFYPDSNLDNKTSQRELRNQVYNQMCERAKLNNYEYLRYVKKEKQ